MRLLKKQFKLIIALVIAVLFALSLQAQVRIGGDTPPVKGTVLDLNNNAGVYIGGLKLPNVALTNLVEIPVTINGNITTTAEKTALTGQIVYNTATSITANIFPGIYYWDGTKWIMQTTAGYGGGANSTDAWMIKGNAGTNPANNFIGTTDNQPLIFKVYNTNAGILSNSLAGAVSFGLNALTANTGSSNNAFGTNALHSNTTGSQNSAFGTDALYTNSTGVDNTAMGSNALYYNNTGNYNSAFGRFAMYTNSLGSNNSAFGYGALYNNTASNNSAFGYNALRANASGTANTAMGVSALTANTSYNNSAFGFQALRDNTSGSYNNAFGQAALRANTTGISNSAFGSNALNSVTSGNQNSAFGREALSANTASNNSAFGYQALQVNTTGDDNSAFGAYTLYSNTTGKNNSAFGFNALRSATGNNNTAIGNGAGYGILSGSNNIAIGYNAQVPIATDDDQISIGNLIYAIGAIGTGGAGNVGIGIITPAHKLDVAGNVASNGVVLSSDINYKKNITDISNPLEIVGKLHGASYEFKTNEFPEKGFSEGKQLGVIAQEIEKVLPELVTAGGDGYKFVNYDGIIPVLIEGMKAQQGQIESQQKIIELLEARLRALEAK